MSSPARKQSPKKGRPSTAVQPGSPARKSLVIERHNISQINIVREINRVDNLSQEKDIEIERLRTTCDQLYARVAITEDIQNQNQVLKRRLASVEDFNERLQAENKQLRTELDQSMSIRTDLQVKLEKATAYVVEMEEKVYKSNKISLEILKELKEAEVEVGALQQYIVDLK